METYLEKMVLILRKDGILLQNEKECKERGITTSNNPSLFPVEGSNNQVKTEIDVHKYRKENIKI